MDRRSCDKMSKNNENSIGQHNTCIKNTRPKRVKYRTIELESWLTSRSTITLAPFRKLSICNGYKYVPTWNQIKPPYYKKFLIAGKNLSLTVITDKSLFNATDRKYPSSESSICESSSSELSFSEFCIDGISSCDSSIGNIYSDISTTDSTSCESSIEFDSDQTTP
ncbi:uncharacterized protein LOC117788717 [Drosophila innubila]|uniref:uncharacterized protein LOC117788717 n=1 Tax=Drosophila innubila TaxID=198719 RepID=UPI00148D8E81|nr:uncharacterized protein LOC117788717 [Drosophila innubila]